MSQHSPTKSQGFKQRQQLIADATGGDANAQSRMGDRCREGDEFTTQDYSEALRWYRLAAEQGDANAMNNVGAMYHNAMGVPEDMAEATKWYRLAADQGLSIAQFNLGLRYLWGDGVEQDDREAVQWFRKASVQGHIEATCQLGTMYRFGRGVERRIPIAAEMHVIAALEGDPVALGNLADYCDEIEQEALSGSMLTALCLAKMCDRGLSVDENKVTEFAWLTWGEQHCNRDDASDVREELADMKGLYSLVLSPADKKAAKALVRHWAEEALTKRSRSKH